MIFVLVLFLCVTVAKSTLTLPESEYLALYALYNSTNGVNWIWSNDPKAGIPWSFTAAADPCTEHWQGVNCTISAAVPENMYHVSELKLPKMNLVGYLPETLGELGQLQHLDLSSNKLGSSIPDSVGELRELQDLVLLENFLTGQIPESLCNLTALKNFNAHTNRLTGTVSSGIGLLTQLQVLDLSSNLLLTGPIPAFIGNLTELQALSFSYTAVTGNIPTALCNLSKLQVLVLVDSALAGPIPSCIGQLTELLVLDLGITHLTGSIPESIGNLVKLRQLSLGSNSLTGTLPASIGNLTQLVALDLYINQLGGSIPASIGHLTQLRSLSLNNNHIHGAIPNSIGNLVLLEYLYLFENQLTNTIPSSIGNLTQLKILQIEQNDLTGWIPHTIGSMTQLHTLWVFTNRMSGPIPPSVTQLPQLQTLYLYDNHLSGPVPSMIGNLSKLTALYAQENKLSGTLPNSLCIMSRLQHLSLFDNHFGGLIPDCVGNLAQLQELSLSSNLISGSIPVSVVQLASLGTLSMSDNMLSGPVPPLLSSVLTLCDLGANSLTGTLPATLQQLPALVQLLLYDNQLVGSIGGAFGAQQAALENVQLDGNQFTGTLPSVLFDLPKLASLSIIGSCLHGTLPSNICNATQLEALILYGLTTGSSCRSRGAQSLSRSHNTFGGAFPSCLLSMPNLVTLLMSSNSLTGSISATAVDRKLLQLDLSHNRLSGSISNVLQNHTWLLLDLSHNKLNGVLQSDLLIRINVTLAFIIHKNAVSVSVASAGPTVSLSSNRLSGSIPGSLMPLHNNLSVLAGNLFECKYDKSDLPQHDSAIHTYECASNSFDISIYIWLGLSVCAVGAVFVLYYIHTTRLVITFIASVLMCNDWHANTDRLVAFGSVQQALLKCAWYCAALCMLVLLPYYAIVSVYQGTHTHQYAYAVSAIYISGVAPFILDMMLLTLLVGILYYGTVTAMTTTITAAAKHPPADVAVAGTHLQRAYVTIIFVFVNITVVLAANIAFVYVVLYHGSELQTLVQVLLSLFKLMWSMLASPSLIRRLVAYFLPPNNEGHAESFFTLQLLVSLFNNIAIPCLVVAAIDPNCFSNILLPPDTETVVYRSPGCEDVSGTCVTYYELDTLRFTPPFTYSYQCSASFITYYAPTFVYMSISTAVLSPLLQYVLWRLYGRMQPGTIAYRLVSRALPPILKPPMSDAPESVGNGRPLLGALGILVTLLTQLGILLTFGAIFPPVALAMAVSISAVVFITRFKVQRFVHAVVEVQQLGCLDNINTECTTVGTQPQIEMAVRSIICYCCVFYAMFLFDTLGDAVGFIASVWVLIVVPLLPWMYFCCLTLYGRISTNIAADGSAQLNKQDVELTAIGVVECEEINVDTPAVTVNVLHSITV